MPRRKKSPQETQPQAGTMAQPPASAVSHDVPIAEGASVPAIAPDISHGASECVTALGSAVEIRPQALASPPQPPAA